MYEAYEKLLKEKGVRTADVCKATGLRQSMFSDWKSGKYQPKQDKLQKIADYFGVPLSTFTGKKMRIKAVFHKQRLNSADASVPYSVNKDCSRQKMIETIVDHVADLYAEQVVKLVNEEVQRAVNSTIDSLLDDYEWELLGSYHLADRGTRAAVRKLLDIQDEDTIPYPDQEPVNIIPIAANAQDGASPEEQQEDADLLNNHFALKKGDAD